VQEQGIHIVKVGAERVDDLEPLARSMHAYHLTVDPAIPGIPPRDEDGWWALRRERYQRWLTAPGAFALVAETDDPATRPIGYAVVSIHGGPDDSHVTGERFAELQSLAVLEGMRGAGVGSALLHAVYAELRALGIEELAIGVLATNHDALRLYEREGFTPWVVITLGKVPPAAQSDR
jgi:GNAT superfamily N-acetyltransferase